jgi:hypothetical protein
MGRAQISWDPYHSENPFACIDVLVGNSKALLDQQGDLGFEFRQSVQIKALIDTGAGPVLISRTYARHCKLFQTRPDSEIRVIGGSIKGGEHAGCISFPNTTLRSYDPIRIVSGDFYGERHFSCLIGIEILRYWRLTFDAKAKMVTIND